MQKHINGPDEPRVEFTAGIIKALPIILATAPFGLLLGAIAAQKGLSLLEIGLMSTLVFAGSAQFVAIDVWSAPAPWLALGFSALLINLRHVLMGASIAPKLGLFPRALKPFAMYFLVDELWALAEARAARAPLTPAFYFGMGLVFIVGWNTWSLLGGVIGPVLGDPAAIGFDFAFTALFIVLIVSFWKGPQTGVVLIASAGTAALVHAHVEGAWYILAGAFAGMIAAAITWRADDGEATNAEQPDWSADTPGPRLEVAPEHATERRS
ncbi:4-azaleucine resistance transporter AzlC [Breoghania corrubedonensis]|uniref:4-azaleucine resistance transporter AzlC n=1 Tax=Breoghania corrubedonensis TaxID=665038 RepID=A0A2T5V4W2_9HYPH|nr:AzlC family ABC transporter permease [Breoghania corrubedonensis]PTW58786.1 4-azaleucine resistance transporter AzlC [Breoghania corrubedonensis]